MVLKRTNSTARKGGKMNLKSLAYDDVLLVPQYSNIRSRNEVNLKSSLDYKNEFALPVISSPMDTVTESAMAIAMHHAGGLGIIHRYNSIEEQCILVRDSYMKGTCTIGAAVGVTEDYEERACAVFDQGAKIICVDVAHGHHILMKEALLSLKAIFGNSVHVMAGNVATLEGLNDLSDWGADSVKCNIGGGSICSTRIQTGHGLSGFQTILDCAKTDRDVKIIADGGMRTPGDIVKALAAGADFVMLGSMLAGTTEAPGESVHTPKGIKKKYRGMASKDAQMDWRGRYSSNEGISTLISHKGSVSPILEDIDTSVKSGLSYSGCRTINELQTKCRWATQTSAGAHEGKTHILMR